MTEIWNPDRSRANVLKSWRWFEYIRHKSVGGGAAIVVNNKVKVIERKDLEKDNLEAVWCEICFEKDNILFGSVYISPNENDAMSSYFEQINHILNLNTNIIVTGDFNAKHQLWHNNDSNNVGKRL